MQKLTIQESEYQSLAQIAARIDFFSTLTGGQLDALLSHILFYAYDPGEVIFKKEAIADAFFIVHSGEVGLIFRPRWYVPWQKKVLLGPGQFFGEMALLNDQPRSATASAHTPLKLFVLLREDFTMILQKNPVFAQHIRQIAASRKFDMRRHV